MDTKGLGMDVFLSPSYATLSEVERGILLLLEERVAGSITLSCIF